MSDLPESGTMQEQQDGPTIRSQLRSLVIYGGLIILAAAAAAVAVGILISSSAGG